jgi:hypothetical protein
MDRIGEDPTGEFLMAEVITTMCRIRPLVPILGMATDTRIQSQSERRFTTQTKAS